MLMNATLLRISDPPPAAPGPDLSVRCGLGVPTAGEAAFLGAMGMPASAVLYLPMSAVPVAGSPAVGQLVTVRPDGCPDATWRVVHPADRVGDVLSHVQVFLEDP